VTCGIPWSDSADGPGHAGAALASYHEPARKDGGGADEAPYNRTCPQFYRRSPFVISVLDELEDYRAGRLGPVDDLEAPRLTYLRVAAAEHAAWERFQLDGLADG
jgi:hypothetical protein